MSFTTDVRLELAHLPEDRRDGALSELCAFVLVNGSLSFKGAGRYGMELTSEQQPVIERYLAMLRRLLSIEGGMRIRHTDRLGGQTLYALAVDEGDAARALDALMLLDPRMPFGLSATPHPQMMASDHQRRALLRGAFLSGGSVVSPKKAYHLEVALQDPLAGCVQQLMRGFGLPARTSQRKAQQLVYLKGAEDVSDTLALLGASKAVMELENVRAMKSLRNEVNRQVNCDQNNLDKTVAAAEKQVSVIRAIERHMGLRELPEPLRELSELRLQHPDASLTELGQMLTPALGKSGVNARMRRLEAIAEELVNQ